MILTQPSITVAIRAIDIALATLPARMDSPPARVLLLAIALQESGCCTRCQADGGPARGLWQFELGGGCTGVLRHPATDRLAAEWCAERNCTPTPRALWSNLERDDALAAGTARLLLATDPRPLPAVDDVPGAWAYYLRNWRPGRPRPEHWAGHHAEARRALGLAS